LGLWRNIDEIKSLEGVDICLLEEAHNLTEEQWHILDGTFRKKGFQFWIIFNPKLATDFVYKRFIKNPPPNTIKRKINYLENPHLDEEYIENVINAMKEEDYDEYCHQFLGEPRVNDDDAIIKRSHILAAIDGHKKLGIEITGSHRIGFDVADDGEDACATVAAYGVLTTDINLWKAKEDEILKSCTKAYSFARVNESTITYDAIGVGASCGGKFNELGYKKHRKFFAGGAVANPDEFIDRHSKIRNKEYYLNIKAQAWWATAERLKNTYNAVVHGMIFKESDMIFIDSGCPHLEQLTEELSSPRKSFDNAGRVMVESKKDLKKRGINSPNVADAFIMAHLPKALEQRKKGSF
jgi:phage terminase large subunit